MMGSATRRCVPLRLQATKLIWRGMNTGQNIEANIREPKEILKFHRHRMVLFARKLDNPRIDVAFSTVEPAKRPEIQMVNDEYFTPFVVPFIPNSEFFK